MRTQLLPLLLCLCLGAAGVFLSPARADQDAEPCPYQPEQMLKIARIFEKNNRPELAMLYCLWIQDEYPESAQIATAKKIFKTLHVRSLHPYIARRLLAIGKRFEERRRWYSAGFAYWRVLKDYPDSAFAEEARESIRQIRNNYLRFAVVPLAQEETLRFAGTKEKDGETLFRFTCAGSDFFLRTGDSIFGFVVSEYDPESGKVTLKLQDQKELIVPISYRKVILPRYVGRLRDTMKKLSINWYSYFDEVLLKDGYSCYGIITEQTGDYVDMDLLVAGKGTQSTRFAAHRISHIARADIKTAPRRTDRFFEAGQTGSDRTEHRVEVFVSHDECDKAAVILENIFRTDERLWLVYGRKKMRDLIRRQENKGLLDVVKNSADTFFREGQMHLACEKYYHLLNSDASRSLINKIQKRVDAIQSSWPFRLNLGAPQVVTLPLSFDKLLKTEKDKSSTTFLIDYNKITYQKTLNDEIDRYRIKQFVNRSPAQSEEEKKSTDGNPRLVFAAKDKTRIRLAPGQRPAPGGKGHLPFLLFDFKTGRYFPAFMNADYVALKDGQVLHGMVSFVAAGYSMLCLESRNFGQTRIIKKADVADQQLSSTPISGPRAEDSFTWDTFTTIRPLITKSQKGIDEGIKEIVSDKPSFYQQSAYKRKMTFFIMIGFFALAVFGFAGVFMMKLKKRIMRAINHTRYAHRRAMVRTKVEETVNYRIYDTALLAQLQENRSASGRKGGTKEQEEFQQKIQELEVKEAALLDISTMGARISTYEKIGKGKVLGLLIPEGQGKTIEIFGRIMNIHKENAGTFHLGISFIQEKTESKLLLLRQCINRMNIVDIDI